MGVALITSSQDVYSIYSTSRKRLLLVMCCCAYLLFPLSDTILLPQLQPIAENLGAIKTVVTASVSIHLVACGTGLLIWGLVVDWCGRLPTIHAVLAIFIGASTGCALAPGIHVLLACRCVQGIVASGTWAVGSAVVADIFHPKQRGMAYGILLMPGQLGPIVAPFLGASLGHAFGWRSTLWFLVGLGVVTQMGVILVYRETQHHRVAAKVHRILRTANRPVPAWALLHNLGDHEQQHSGSRTCTCTSWVSTLRALRQMTVLPFSLLLIHMFACQFLLLVQLPEQLTAAGVSSLFIGLSYVVTGLCSMVGSIAGGWLSDRASSAAVRHQCGTSAPAADLLNVTNIECTSATSCQVRCGSSVTDCTGRVQDCSNLAGRSQTQHETATSSDALATRSSSASRDADDMHFHAAPNSDPACTQSVSCAGDSKTARVEFACWLNLVLMPTGVLLFGWAGGLRPKAAVVASTLLGSCMATFAYSFLSPAVFSHVSNNTGTQAGTAGALVPAGMNAWAGAVTQIYPVAHASLGAAVLDTTFAASVLPLATCALAVCLHHRQGKVPACVRRAPDSQRAAGTIEVHTETGGGCLATVHSVTSSADHGTQPA